MWVESLGRTGQMYIICRILDNFWRVGLICSLCRLLDSWENTGYLLKECFYCSWYSYVFLFILRFSSLLFIYSQGDYYLRVLLEEDSEEYPIVNA